MYTSLDSRLAQIRILHLHPGRYNEDIKCTLSISTPKTSFEALSYVWGNSKDTVNIEVEGELTPVTKNLEAALRHLRTENEIRDLWVDAICINQNDNDERTHQVGMMDVIYQDAQRVIAWLGIERNTDTFELISNVARDPDRHWDVKQNPDANDNIAPGVFTLFAFLKGTEWFQRIWTVQEAVLAKSIIYISGSYVFENGEINDLIRSFNNHFITRACCDLDEITIPLGFGHMESIIAEYLEKISNLMNIWDKRGTTTPFLEIASKFRHRMATDPRDKIFGILGLTEDLTKDVIDYKLPVSAVYTKAALQLIKNTRNLDVLSHVLPTNPKDANYLTDLPSWSPDWSWDYVRENWRLTSVLKRQEYMTFFNACGQNSTPQEQDSAVHLGRLTLVGHQCGYIARLGSPFKPKDKKGGRSIRNYPLEVLQEWRAMANVDRTPQQAYGIPGPSQAQTTILDAFWRTLCGDINPFDSKAGSVQQADDETRGCHDVWWWDVLQQTTYRDISAMEGHLPHEKVRGFYDHVISMAAGRRFIISTEGLFGLVSENAQLGDQIWVVNGGRMPLLIRSPPLPHDIGLENKFIFVGDSYIYGIMKGESNSCKTLQQNITLI